MLDAIIIGGGPAGLSAALILGRCRRNVVLFDSGRPRNAYSHGMHGYLSRDGMPPSEFLQTGRDQLKPYTSVKIIDEEVVEAKRLDTGFEIFLRNGNSFKTKKLLLATGVVDCLPKIEGIGDLWGRSVFNCPYCDGWEMSDRPIAVYGKDDRGFNLSLSIRHVWSQDVILFTDGPSELDQSQKDQLARNGIILNEEKMVRLEGENGQLKNIVLENGKKIPRDSLFFNTPSFLRSKLLEQLGCPFSEDEGVETGKYERTEIPGLYVAGNILREVQLVIVAASQGAEAAFGINTALSKESRIS